MVAKKTSAKPKTTKLPTTTSSTASLVASAFSPASSRLNLFASVVLGLDAYRLRIHDTNTGRLTAEHVFEAGVKVNALAWGTLPGTQDKERKASKKRRRKDEVDEELKEKTRSAVIAASTNKGQIVLFSPAEGAVVGTLEGSHVGEVVDVRCGEAGKAWSVGIDAKCVEWDLIKKTAVNTITLPESAIRRLAVTNSHILCASSTVYALSSTDPSATNPPTFTANTTSIHTLLASSDGSKFLSAAETDRFINVFSLSENKQISALVAESDVVSVSIHKGAQDEVLAAVTADGSVEVFKAPYDASAAAAEAGSRKKKATTKKAEATIKIVRPGTAGQVVSVAAAAVEQEEVVLAVLDGAVNVAFEKIRWASPEDGSFVLTGENTITRSKTASGIAALNNAMNGVKAVGSMTVDASNTVVVGGDNMEDVGMEDARAAPEEEEEVSESESENGSDDEDADKEVAEPTFADRFSALTVSAAPRTNASLTPATNRAPTAGALTAVLSQALKTNDTSLLESCLSSTNTKSIRDTVRRLPSPLAVMLLERLAERLARKPGRAGSLGEWVRWTLVAHGGYLVTLPDLVRRLASLHSTLNQRANALPRLLALQGRLDMLQSQLELRSEMRPAKKQPDVDDEEEALYIEGETEEVDSDEEPEEVEGLAIEDASYIKSRSRHGRDTDNDDSESGSEGEEEDSDDEDMDDEEEEEEEGEDEDGYMDLEASDASDDEEIGKDVKNGEVDYDDVDEDEDMEEEEEMEVVQLTKRKSKSRR